jgi:potassium channel subfamily K
MLYENTKINKRTKICVCIVVITGLIVIGIMIAHLTEKLYLVDSFYLSVSSVTTVGYSDYLFKTSDGKLWGSIWILINTVVVARSFTYLSELDLQRRSGDMSKWICKKKITPSDLVAAGLGKDGVIRYISVN